MFTAEFTRLADAVIECKRQTLAGETSTNEEVAFIREVGHDLVAKASVYPWPTAQ